MLVHCLFGAKSSPSCASFALRKVADDNETHASPVTVLTVKRNFYVDNCLKSVKGVKEAIQLIKELSMLLKTGGFHLMKYLNNCREVLSAIDHEDLDPRVKTLYLDNLFVDLPVNRTLGVFWNTENDEFEIKVELKQRPATRRGILSMTSQVFDPLGMVQLQILPAKKLMQRLCQLNLGWYDKIPTDLESQWTKWLHELPKLEAISIPRWFHPFSELNTVELHCFCDDSAVGYGAVCYLRLVFRSAIHCSFVIGKSRVAPLKTVTIPRLELCAATIAVKLARLVRQELELTIDRTVFWTDSTSVLQYIMNTSCRFETFVANRLAIILDG